ncbi:GNAT family N-acetyltransferase [Nocardioides houyundeii]|uniref:GNAT family N-acetyltransferase n=1 Tax=Nocardioides houyundeii TaxID=2045452 RepID=UPI000DF2EE9A|nr:GNAT family N-acetyltransferase [Nocardioides houyundeii]
MTPSPVRVRVARSEELGALGDLTLAAYEPFTLGPDDPYVARLRDTAARAREGVLLVAEDQEGSLLGCVTWCPAGSPLRELAQDHEGEFRMLAVAPRCQGRGAGAALVHRCHELAAGLGATSMVISSLAEMTTAHRLYGRLGYEREPTRDWSPATGVDLVAFVRPLDVGHRIGYARPR